MQSKKYFMSTNIVSIALAAYAIYNSIKQSKMLSENKSMLTDLQKDTQTLEQKITVVDNTPTVLDEALQVSYTLRVGRPTNWNMLSTRMDITIANTSKSTPYSIDAVAVVPSLGVSFGDVSRDHIYFRQFSNPITVYPGQDLSTYWHYNNTVLIPDKREAIFSAILQKFRSAFGWDSLGNSKAEIADGVTATVYIRASVTFADQTKMYVVRKYNVPGLLRWCGGFYRPGDSGVVSFDKMMAIFGNNE